MSISEHLPKLMSPLLDWAISHSLRAAFLGSGCCGSELNQTHSCKYDLNRFGITLETNPTQTDLLIVSTVVNQKLASVLKEFYAAMKPPRFVVAVGSCACSGGLFSSINGVQTSLGIQSLDQVIPVDIFIPGCPPRPEAIMNGIIQLQTKITKGNYHGSGSRSFRH
jgi:NADH-quinone oxidoreductase subunit B